MTKSARAEKSLHNVTALKNVQARGFRTDYSLPVNSCPLRGLLFKVYESTPRKELSVVQQLSFLELASVVQTLDGTIQRINDYPMDKYYGNQLRYPLDSDFSGGQRYPTFEQPGPAACH